jgi:tetratricopeptide (TPR) repeat protein
MRTLLIAIVLVISLLAAEEPKKPAPPDRKAYSEAQKISDPRKKIDALRKFVGEYPKSTSANSANDLILQTLARSFPYRTHEIREQADLILKNVTKRNQAAKRQQVADTFADNGVLLKWGEELARTALKQLKEKNSIEVEMKYYRTSKEKTPDKETFHQHYQIQRARFLATLGKIYVKEGDLEEGERLLKEAYAASPTLSSVAVELARLAGRAGNYDTCIRLSCSGAFDGCVAAGRSEIVGEFIPKETWRPAGRIRRIPR